MESNLTILEKNHLMQDVLYVDVLNEYPLWHGYSWLTNEITALGPAETMQFDFLNLTGKRQFNQQQIKFYNDFINQTLDQLKNLWPKVKFMASQTNTLNTPWQDLDISHFDVLDIHQWMIYNESFSQFSGYFDGIHTLKDEQKFKPTNQKMRQYWIAHKTELIQWLSDTMKERSAVGRKLNIPFGCTEGWGPVMWMDHKDLDWSFVKESGMIAAKLGVEHGYSFNCSSNFTHPHFEALWEDTKWHKEVTRTIRKT